MYQAVADYLKLLNTYISFQGFSIHTRLLFGIDLIDIYTHDLLLPPEGDIFLFFVFQDHFKSAYFFFEGVFYNDMRYPECRDISR